MIGAVTWQNCSLSEGFTLNPQISPVFMGCSSINPHVSIGNHGSSHEKSPMNPLKITTKSSCPHDFPLKNHHFEIPMSFGARSAPLREFTTNGSTRGLAKMTTSTRLLDTGNSEGVFSDLMGFYSGINLVKSGNYSD
jgi:hypothetical protein